MLERWRRLTRQQGFAWSLLLVLVWFGYWFVVNPGTNANGPTYLDVDIEPADAELESFRPLVIWVGGALLVFAFMTSGLVHLIAIGAAVRGSGPEPGSARAGRRPAHPGPPSQPEVDGG